MDVDQSPMEAKYNAADWISQGKQYKDVPTVIVNELTNLSIPPDVFPRLSSDNLPINMQNSSTYPYLACLAT